MSSGEKIQAMCTDRKEGTYHLCRGVTKTGKQRYCFAREPKGEPVEEVPEGHEIRESVNGVVSLAKERATRVLLGERVAVEDAIGGPGLQPGTFAQDVAY